MLCVLFFCVFLWEIERTLAMRWYTNKLLVSFFSHRSHRFNRIFLRTVSNSQNASGIQISQSVKTIVDTNKGQHKADILLIGVSRWSLPSPFGAGLGVRPLLGVTFCEIGWLNVSVECCVFCSSLFSVRKRTIAKLAGEFFLSQSSQI